MAAELHEKYPLGYEKKVLWERGYDQTERIVVAFTLFVEGDYQCARKEYEKVDVQVLNFDFRKYFCIQYQLLTLGFCSGGAVVRRERIKAGLEEMIRETGLVYFRGLIDTFDRS